MIWKRILVGSGIFLLGVIVGLHSGRLPFLGGTSAARLLPHYNNSARARAIKPGTTLSQLLDALGDPVGASEGWLLFDPSPTGRNIRVKLDSAGLVQEIDAGENQRDG